MNRACYRKLRRYKYQLTRAYALNVGIKGYAIETPYITLDRQGNLTIQKSYAWDGPSGPTLDTLNFMRGSLVHDTLYQLIRLQKLPYAYKEYADLLLQKHCLEDGMSKFRSSYVYWAVKLFGGAAAKPGTDQPDEITCVPVG